ncbi:unnamed protein product [Camellia sinensis]
MDDVCLEWRMFAPVYNGMDVVYLEWVLFLLILFTGLQEWSCYWNGNASGIGCLQVFSLWKC